MPTRRVLFVCPVGTRGGVESSLFALWQCLDRQQVDSRIFFLRDGPFVSEVKRLGLPVHVNPISRLLAPAEFVRAVESIRRFAEAQRADVIVNSLGYTHLFGALAARLAGIKTIWWSHALATRSQWLDRLAATLPTDLVLNVSERAREAHRRQYPAIRTCVVYPGLDLPGWRGRCHADRSEILAELNIPLGSSVIASVGRLEEGKGQDVLIKAFAEVGDDANAYLLLAGEDSAAGGSFHRKLEQMVSCMGIDSRVRLLGPRTDIPNLLAGTDVFVHAARYPESFGVSILEALASGVPVVATRVGGPEEILGDSGCGVLVRPDDPLALAAAIRTMLCDVPGRTEMGQRARARSEDFDVRVTTNSFCRAIEEAMACAGAA